MWFNRLQLQSMNEPLKKILYGACTVPALTKSFLTAVFICFKLRSQVGKRFVTKRHPTEAARDVAVQQRSAKRALTRAKRCFHSHLRLNKAKQRKTVEKTLFCVNVAVETLSETLSLNGFAS